MASDLLKALEASDAAKASKHLKEQIQMGAEAWDLHLSLFPLVQRVLNPPFINPHLPKMYRIYREFTPYLRKDEILALIQLELSEYAKRPKLEKLPKASLLTSPVSFRDVESAIRKQDWEKTAVLMASFHSQEGGEELARRLLLLGSGYLGDSLGHSVSCTSFILLEMIERVDQDPWPALATLADYFCKGGFYSTPALRKAMVLPPDEAVKHHLLQATSGLGIVNLHHTITLYAMDRARRFFSEEEYNQMISAWIAFMGNKKAEQVAFDRLEVEPTADYTRFYDFFSKRETKPVVKMLKGMITSQQGRRQLGSLLIKGVCDQYQGSYNPHYLTGLGSALWVVNCYWNQPQIPTNALFQYVDFFFKGIKS